MGEISRAGESSRIPENLSHDMYDALRFEVSTVKILVTVAAVSSAITRPSGRARGDEVVGLDNVNDYYDVSLKAAPLARLAPAASFALVRMDLAHCAGLADLFARERFDRVNLRACFDEPQRRESESVRDSHVSCGWSSLTPLGMSIGSELASD